MKCGARPRIAASLLLASLAQPCRADPAPVIHYAPAENLEHVDVALIDRAEHEIDMAAYVLTDWPVMQALTRSADRGVAIRIYLDGTQLAEREPAKVFNDLAETPGVEIRIKHKARDPMHLKSYQIDGKLRGSVDAQRAVGTPRAARTMAANWPRSRVISEAAASR